MASRAPARRAMPAGPMCAHVQGLRPYFAIVVLDLDVGYNSKGGKSNKTRIRRKPRPLHIMRNFARMSRKTQTRNTEHDLPTGRLQLIAPNSDRAGYDAKVAPMLVDFGNMLGRVGPDSIDACPMLIHPGPNSAQF